MGGDALRLGRYVGLASRWPRITDISGSPPTGSRTFEWEMSTHLHSLVEYDELYLYY